jgi:hypothetical protein
MIILFYLSVLFYDFMYFLSCAECNVGKRGEKEGGGGGEGEGLVGGRGGGG